MERLRYDRSGVRVTIVEAQGVEGTTDIQIDTTPAVKQRVRLRLWVNRRLVPIDALEPTQPDS